MFGLPWSKLLRFGVPGLVLIAFTLWVLAVIRDRDGQRAVADAHRACMASIERKRGAKSLDEACPASVAAAVVRAQKAAACDGAIAAVARDPAGGAFALQQTCSAEVKTLEARRAAAAADILDRERTIARLRDDQAAAVARAEVRARNDQRRKDDAQAAIRDAPRADDGLALCDADCLRRLGGG